MPRAKSSKKQETVEELNDLFLECYIDALFVLLKKDPHNFAACVRKLCDCKNSYFFLKHLHEKHEKNTKSALYRWKAKALSLYLERMKHRKG